MNKRIFKQKEVLTEMLLLRLSGWPLYLLAFRYNCNITSVRKACMKYHISPRIRTIVSPTIVFIEKDEERINKGKTYAEYLAESKARQLIKRP